MLSEEDLIFLDGWVRKIEKLPAPILITKNNAAVVVNLDFIGFFHSALFETTDSNITMTLTLNQAELSVNIQEIYNWGYTQPNSAMPYIGTYSPTNGTAGHYTVIWTPSKLIPVKRKFYLRAMLDPDSTQNTAVIDVGVVYYLIYNEEAFKRSLKEYFSYVLPKSTSPSAPITNQSLSGALPSANNKYNPFEYIP
jgi:hypothetical protein